MWSQALWQALLRKAGLHADKGGDVTQLCALSEGLTPGGIHQVSPAVPVHAICCQRLVTLSSAGRDTYRHRLRTGYTVFIEKPPTHDHLSDEMPVHRFMVLELMLTWLQVFHLMTTRWRWTDGPY